MDTLILRDDTRLACDCCGEVWPAELIDAKPEPGADPETADWTRLECPRCYGPGWAPLYESGLFAFAKARPGDAP